ncbi:hypothetical protein BDP55DRAFT_721913 [Colletotrichum godetiae]|uniref:DUF5672 domain-containing protein n=1 Tax=Colletotrichum godetiae TaxID=1209918 RepID=A0AAJ0EMQ2_9PEZI|nr:uncharacterized protein BDP55DRAFT_721913 [Colletotrichum godetiae]KAK1656807.1 hypothetical protein BDP55DRAFT_721913 [Colletotrichum godetiae]
MGKFLVEPFTGPDREPAWRRRARSPLLPILVILAVIVTWYSPIDTKFGSKTVDHPLDRQSEIVPSTAKHPFYNPTPTQEEEQNAFYTPDTMDAQRPKTVAVIVETSASRMASLVPALVHTSAALGPQWPIVLVTRKENWNAKFRPALRRLLEAKQVQVTFIPDSMSVATTSFVFPYTANSWLWKHFRDVDQVLLLQRDSKVCSTSTPNLDKFLDWDMVSVSRNPALGQRSDDGVSLRNPKMMASIARDLEGISGMGEFLFDERWLLSEAKKRGARLPDEGVAMEFALEVASCE